MADAIKMSVNVEPYIDQRKLQSQIDRQAKDIKITAELIITQNKQFPQKLLKEIKNYYTQLEKYQTQYATSNINFYALEIKKNEQFLKNYTSLLQKQESIRNELNGIEQAEYNSTSVKQNSSNTLSDTSAKTDVVNPAASLLAGLQTTINIVSQFNNLLTGLSNTSALTAASLNQLGAAAYNTASQYGTAAREYLQVIQEMGSNNTVAEQTEQFSALGSINNFLTDMTKEYTIAVIGAIAAETAAAGATVTLSQSLKVLSAAFIGSGFGAVILGVTALFSLFTFAIQKNQQQQQEYLQKTKEQAEKANVITDEISTLTGKYYALTESVKTNEDVKSSLLSTQSELLEKLGLEGQTIDELTDKYGSLDNAIKETSLKELRNAEADLILNLGITKDDLLAAGKGDIFSSDSLVVSDFTDSKSKRAYKALYKEGLIDGNSPFLNTFGESSIDLPGSSKTIDGILENYERLIELRNALLDSDEFTDTELADNKIFVALNKKINNLTPSIEAYKQTIFELNKNLSTQEIVSAFQTQDIPQTQEEFIAFKQTILDTLLANNDFAGSEEHLKAAVDNTLASFIEFSNFTDDVGTNMTTIAEQTEEYYKKQNEEIDKFQSSMSTLKSALENVSSLSSSDIIDLMQQYGDFNWSDWGVTGVQGVGDLEGALKALTTQQYSSLDSTLAQKEGLESLYDEAMTVTQSVLSVSEALENLNSTGQVISDVNEEFENFGYISNETLNNLIKKYPELDGVVTEYNLGLASTEDVLSELTKCYDTDFENYKKAVISKMGKSETFYKQILNELPDWVKNLSDSYEIELENYSSYIQGKLALEKKYYEALADVNKKEIFYKQVQEGTKMDLSDLPTLMRPSFKTLNDKLLVKAATDLEQSKNELNNYISIIEALDKTFNDEAGLSDKPIFEEYSSTSSPSSSTPANSSKTSSSYENRDEKQTVFSKQINYADDRIKVLQKDLDKLNTQLTNTSSLEKQADTYQQLIDKQTELAKAYSTVTGKEGIYSKAYQEALNNKKLFSKDKERIKSGALTIENYTGKGENSKGELGYDAALAAMEARDNLKEMQQNYSDNFDKIRQYAKDMAGLPWEIANEKVETLNSELDLLNEQLNNTTDYDAKISLLDIILDKQKQIVAEQQTATDTTKKNLDNTYGEISEKYLTTASGKKIKSGTKIQTAQAKYDPEELTKIITYNMLVDAYKESTDKLALADEKLNGIKLDNYSEQFDALNEKAEKTIKRHSDLLSLTNTSLSFFDEGSVEHILLLQTTFEQAQNKSAALIEEIQKLKSEYSKGNLKITLKDYESMLADLDKQLMDSGKTVMQYQKDIISGMKKRYDNELALSSKALKKTLDDIETKKKAELDAIEDQLDKYKEYIETRKKILNKDKADQDHQEELDEYTSVITKLESRIAILSQAEATGDRTAGKERRELEEQLAEEKNKLADYQTEYGLNKAIEALDNEYSEFEKNKKLEKKTSETVFELDIAKANKAYEEKETHINNLYETEKNLILEAAKLTEEEFSKAFASINSTLSSYGLSLSAEQVDTIRDVITDTRTTDDSTKNASAIKTLLESGTSLKGNSALNKYISAKYGSNLSYSQMLKLAELLGINEITKIDDVKIAKNRQKILTTLQAAKFSNGGTVDASKSNSPIAAMFGEDGIAFVKHNEEILTAEKANLLRSLLNVTEPLTNITKLAAGNISNLMTNNYSSPTIQFNLNGGTITPEAMPQFNNWKNDIVRAVSKAIIGDVRKR